MEFARARQAFEAGDWTAASEICRQLLKKNKKDVHALQLMGRLHAQSGNDDQAASYYNQSLKHQPRDPAVHFLLAELALGQGRAQLALERLNKALRLKPDFNAALIQKAAVLERIGHYDEARNCCRTFRCEARTPATWPASTPGSRCTPGNTSKPSTAPTL
jgi:Flp pilus assembly protein TadD